MHISYRDHTDNMEGTEHNGAVKYTSTSSDIEHLLCHRALSSNNEVQPVWYRTLAVIQSTNDDREH